jgi:hypothetical protein
MAITEKRASLDNIGGYKVPMPDIANEDFPDAESYLRDTEKRNETGEGPQAPLTAAKPKIVTKEQMQKAGFDNLRDYLNAQQGLKRRGESTASSNTADMEKGNSRGIKSSVVMAPKMTMGQGKKPYDPGSVDNSFTGSKFAKGGVTRSSASKRADGCATKGFTKGKNL